MRYHQYLQHQAMIYYLWELVVSDLLSRLRVQPSLTLSASAPYFIRLLREVKSRLIQIGSLCPLVLHSYWSGHFFQSPSQVCLLPALIVSKHFLCVLWEGRVFLLPFSRSHRPVVPDFSCARLQHSHDTRCAPCTYKLDVRDLRASQSSSLVTPPATQYWTLPKRMNFSSFNWRQRRQPPHPA